MKLVVQEERTLQKNMPFENEEQRTFCTGKFEQLSNVQVLSLRVWFR
jgi:hypothetical protein